MIENIHFLFFSYFENISTCFLPCKVSSQNSYGKCHYFNFTFRIRLAAITQLKNDRDRTLRVGSSFPKDFVTSKTQHVTQHVPFGFVVCVPEGIIIMTCWVIYVTNQVKCTRSQTSRTWARIYERSNGGRILRDFRGFSVSYFWAV